ncbi:hypothetical protein MDV099.5 [Gallid alphaherpesvirus 2]|uniref:Uncharacterized protein n=1 Tax=Gallid alphaherpesvirus 2 TaxID=10390 RepID=H6WV42_9ALPH|nr:hypothetical protein MDV084.5 [Gallid alphaherpesvirus 2]AEZ51800.1 hypothetical protein MDV99.5 [Gallid alphaherpesvirus 2]UOW61187.1 hypothetical protein MDV084.5 [Gallid alphaherpesvirus 2]UOW61219.1 hypothetical protein MDV099.5 [Gallid alphaherpesvirus 2]UOW62038.1 hypothetical protein MDV084.5 [Gallid alphaherpesvirus 2]
MVFKYLFTGHGHLKLCNRSAGHNLTRWAGLVCVLEMQCWHLNYLKYTGAGTNLIPHFAIGGGGGSRTLAATSISGSNQIRITMLWSGPGIGAWPKYKTRC